MLSLLCRHERFYPTDFRDSPGVRLGDLTDCYPRTGSVNFYIAFRGAPQDACPEREGEKVRGFAAKSALELTPFGIGRIDDHL